jgi:hypothetical protein
MPAVSSRDDDDDFQREVNPLNIAAYLNLIPALKEHLAAGVPVDPNDGTSPLINATCKGHLEAARLLIEAGADVNRRKSGGETPLGEACAEGHLAMAEFLVSKGARADASVLGAATTIRGGHQPIVAFLARHLPPNTVTTTQRSLLMCACLHGDLETAKFLLEQGADVNYRGHGSALSVAEEHGHRVLADFLLERGATPVRASREVDAHRDALHAAASEQPRDVARRLAWGQWLLTRGLRAAAAREFQAVVELGGEAPHVTVENPPGTRWAFERFAQLVDTVSPEVGDAWFPRALLTHGARRLPLVVLGGPSCTGGCDERGEVTCPLCNDTGTWHDEYLGSSECEKRARCTRCWSLKYVMISQHFSKGTCAHATTEREVELGRVSFVRCTTCSLGGIDHGTVKTFACAVCGHFVCRCKTST